jgi:ADP-ribose pyrophosphatase
MTVHVDARITPHAKRIGIIPAYNLLAGTNVTRGVRVLNSEVTFRSRVFTVRRDQIIEPGGTKAVRDIVVHSGSVVVLPVFPNGHILLIRQYRYATKQFLWELVAGGKEPDETDVAGAHRELREETGYLARRMRKLLEVFPSPGVLSEHMEIFLAEGLTKGDAHPEEDEKITVKIVPLTEALKWIRTGKIRDAKSVSGILYYAHFVARKKR